MNVFLQSVDMSNRAITELRLKNEPPDILIRPDVEGIGLLDQVDVPTLARLGEEAAKAILPDLTRVMRRSRGLFNILFGRK
jgi:predicted acylesterase/phospholipase RssA